MTTTYLKYFPKPVLDDLVNGRWLPIIGAGMSLNAHVTSGQRPPLWGELGKLLEDDLIDFNSSGALDAISAYEHELGRARLMDKLTQVLLIHEAQPGAAHKSFCSIPFDIVCTTNFDFLLEQEYRLGPNVVYPILEEEQLSLNSSKAGVNLLKLHGDLHHPRRMVVTEADYDGFLANYPLFATYLANLLITKTAVLVGYSLDDPDFRQIWHVVSQRLGRTRRFAYTIVVGANQSDISRFERRGVKVINLPGTRDKYGEILAAAFDELRELLRDEAFTVMKPTEERAMQELSLPRSAPSRLCFFSLPLEVLPFYKDQVFPALEDINLVPITADGIISPGDMVIAKLDALIDRSIAMVIDLSSNWTMVELKMAISRAASRRREGRPLELIVVMREGQQLPTALEGVKVIYRPDLLTSQSEDFAIDLIATLEKVLPSDRDSQLGEARRLLRVKEYRAAIVSAVTYLEGELRSVMRFRDEDVASRPHLSLLGMIKSAAKRRVIDDECLSDLHEWIHIRNGIVHSRDDVFVSQRLAKTIVDGIVKIVDGFPPTPTLGAMSG
ncbi:SIR2 family protein [Pseudomonas sp. p106]|uniref:SIR2 family NAD-dependent protein deacylase n=1 Tax=Pseudomonas sp. p106 TaxID=2479854 RepID=UPI000F77714E|nr:SIR2 family protein [Pseudomonas sp. p106]RRV40099.1 SIR2 family protein [Pseudomonas sp. p106]